MPIPFRPYARNITTMHVRGACVAPNNDYIDVMYDVHVSNGTQKRAYRCATHAFKWDMVFCVCYCVCLVVGMLSLSVFARECFVVFYAADDKHQSIRIRSLRGFAITDGH